MTDLVRIYLDNAATSWPKPTRVYEAVDHYQREIGAAAGRGVYAEAAEAERLVAAARRRVAQLMGVREPRHIVFGHNGTDMLNLALHGSMSRASGDASSPPAPHQGGQRGTQAGLVGPGDHIVTTVVEHNSVLRPLSEMRSLGIDVSYVACDGQGIVDADEVRRAVRRETRLIAVNHASNVTGAIQPVDQIGQIAAEREIPLLLDAAQTLGHVPIDASHFGTVLVAASGHKGLLGPLGTGVLYIHPDLTSRLRPMRQGGTGTVSQTDVQPTTMPDRFESGNHNVLGLAGLAAGAEWVVEQTVEQLRSHERELTRQLIEGLRDVPGVRLFGPKGAENRVGVVSCLVDGYEPQEVASLLDTVHGIQVRGGLHCAPRIHDQLGTLAEGGTIRFSIGPFNTMLHIQQAVEALRGIAEAAV